MVIFTLLCKKKLLMRAGDTDKAEIVDTKIFLYLAKNKQNF